MKRKIIIVIAILLFVLWGCSPFLVAKHIYFGCVNPMKLDTELSVIVTMIAAVPSAVAGFLAVYVSNKAIRLSDRIAKNEARYRRPILSLISSEIKIVSMSCGSGLKVKADEWGDFDIWDYFKTNEMRFGWGIEMVVVFKVMNDISLKRISLKRLSASVGDEKQIIETATKPSGTVVPDGGQLNECRTDFKRTVMNNEEYFTLTVYWGMDVEQKPKIQQWLNYGNLLIEECKEMRICAEMNPDYEFKDGEQEQAIKLLMTFQADDVGNTHVVRGYDIRHTTNGYFTYTE